ncbi:MULTISPECIES: flavin reductase family protein [unclassified Amycolatopsis]|uniref:flavin reductase family protein n=1 Tax=unclassified Amycolatopsis TaxID=2618356 RepID=UPI001C6A2240|nr:flavin reductase family protein [Amycolatopsis sp. DSM 110486]QYN20229.1 flavin reductase family protein [Amycolatopsis sp. DSM 110486]
MVDEAAFRELMGAVCAPVTVVTTTTGEGRPHGTTVSSFASLSLRPPMVSFALDTGSALLSHVRESRRVGVNVLAHGQESVATAFAGRGEAKFAGFSWRDDDGLPRLTGAGGWLVGTVTQLVSGGDHVLVLAEVMASEVADAPPLVYARRTFGTHSRLGERAEPLS